MLLFTFKEIKIQVFCIFANGGMSLLDTGIWNNPRVDPETHKEAEKLFSEMVEAMALRTEWRQ